MRIIIATDAWFPQTNGVVTTLNKTANILRESGNTILVINPEYFKTLPMPTYPEIRLSLFPGRKVKQLISEFAPDAIHIATEGPIGFATRAYCLRNNFPFTTSYHTQYPEYVRLRIPIPVALTYRLLKWFHHPAVRTMVPTESQCEKLVSRNFEHVLVWTRGVDTELFRPLGIKKGKHQQPVFIYVGRVAVEKNLEAFLSLDLPGRKIIVGDGPDRQRLKNRYPDTVFTGYQYGEQLAKTIAMADVFVFPSKTDTFGLVMLEAMACGLPIAAFPVTGPKDVVINGVTGILNQELSVAANQALELDRTRPRSYALNHSWHHSTESFFNYLAPRQSVCHPQSVQHL